MCVRKRGGGEEGEEREEREERDREEKEGKERERERPRTRWSTGDCFRMCTCTYHGKFTGDTLEVSKDFLRTKHLYTQEEYYLLYVFS